VTVKVPSTEAEVFKQYYSHVKFLVSRAGIRKDYVDDYAMILITKFMERGMLKKYDPEHLSEVNGVKRTANFKTFLSGFVNAYLRSFAKRDAINAGRSYYSSDMLMGENKDIPLLDYLGMSVSDDTQKIEVDELIQSVKDRLKSNENLGLFFEIILLQVEEYGRVEVGELSEMFEVTRSTIYNWIKKLRVEFEKCQ